LLRIRWLSHIFSTSVREPIICRVHFYKFGCRQKLEALADLAWRQLS
jgi:hypothetical protein